MCIQLVVYHSYQLPSTQLNELITAKMEHMVGGNVPEIEIPKVTGKRTSARSNDGEQHNTHTHTTHKQRCTTESLNNGILVAY